MIVGPPGAGKTTALKHSGLVFPYQGAGGGARPRRRRHAQLRLVVHERGHPPRHRRPLHDRVATTATSGSPSSQMLKKYRSRQPINGVIVAISVAELHRRERGADRGDRQEAPRPHRRDDDAAPDGRAGLRALHQVRPHRRLQRVLRRHAQERARAGLGRDAPARPATRASPGKIFDDEFDVLREAAPRPRAEAPGHASGTARRARRSTSSRSSSRASSATSPSSSRRRSRSTPSRARRSSAASTSRAARRRASPLDRVLGAHGAGDGHPPARARRRSRSSSRRATSSTTSS